MNRFYVFALCLVLSASAAAQEQDHSERPKFVPLTNELTFDRGNAFDELVESVEQRFAEPALLGDQWKANVSKWRKTATQAESRDAYAEAVNELLATLNRSHTYYFSTLNPKRYQLLGIFHAMVDRNPREAFLYEGIGIDTRRVGEKVYVTSVYDGLPAAKADVMFGDEIVDVDGAPFHPILSFKNFNEKQVRLNLIRDGQPKEVEVKVAMLDGRSMFQTALEASVRVIERKGKKVGYVHPWSYTGREYHQTIADTILRGKLSDCDALVLDLRDGWGGASPEYLNLFREPFMEFESTPRDGEPMKFTGVWGKPIVLLTNRRSTSGKELFSYGFKKLGLGKIVGENTAGAVLAGSPIIQKNGDVLYLAVAQVKVDGQVLEGVGVAPNIDIPRAFDGSNENANAKSPDRRDPQLEAAIEQAVKQ